MTPVVLELRKWKWLKLDRKYYAKRKFTFNSSPPTENSVPGMATPGLCITFTVFSFTDKKQVNGIGESVIQLWFHVHYQFGVNEIMIFFHDNIYSSSPYGSLYLIRSRQLCYIHPFIWFEDMIKDKIHGWLEVVDGDGVSWDRKLNLDL